MQYKPLPIGTDDFKKLISNGYYYVDKTLLIKELLDKLKKVNLLTRPRRFGKTLNMSMLQYFFEDTGDSQMNAENRQLFNGLKILDMDTEYLSQMNGYPVISLSLKSAKQSTWELSYACLKEAIANEFQRHKNIIPSIPVISDQKRFIRILERQGKEEDFLTALAFLSRQLMNHYQKPAIILIDEYDVPLANAYLKGFYQQMVDFIRSLFESALKTNPSLHFAVLTGCLSIIKESIFTGLNNLKMNSILSGNYGEYFGFTPEETQKLLESYRLDRKISQAQEWYDGYLFGNSKVYNPWSILNYIDAFTNNPDAFPIAYWSNTSSNNIIRSLIERADFSVRAEIEDLIAGGTIEKPVHEDITYEDVYDSMDNLWNFLFFTGYLKKSGQRVIDDDIYVTFSIPNKEVRQIYKNKILNWFREEIGRKDLSDVYKDIFEGNTAGLEKGLTGLLRDTISFYNNAEAFYHGFMAGVLSQLKTYLVKSNRESGDGRYDIAIQSLDITEPVIILELKTAKDFHSLEEKAQEALAQIEEKKYDYEFANEGYQKSIRYGIAFYKKNCKIKKQEINL